MPERIAGAGAKKPSSPKQRWRALCKRFNSETNARRRILVFHEQYGNRYYVARTMREACRAFISILRERDSQQWYDFETPRGEYPDVPEDQIDALPTERLREMLRCEWEKYRVDERERAEARRIGAIVRTAVDKGDQIAAWQAANALRSGQYEGWDFEYLEEVDDA